MAAVGQGLPVDEVPGPSVEEAVEPSPVVKRASIGSAKGAANPAGAAAAAKSERSSSSPQRHSIQKTMSK